MENIKILIVDDESIVRTFVKMVVHRQRLPVELIGEADNGEDAVRLASQQQPDLVFMDVRIPGYSGIQAAEKILEADCNIKIVIISAYDEFEYARRAFRAGVYDYLLKPVRPADIEKIVNQTAREKTSRKSLFTGSEKSALIKSVENYVQLNIDKPLHLNDIAKAVYVSPFHLSRTFKQLTGQSIVDYIQNLRLERAEKLLLETVDSVTEIAVKVGFNDGGYFATCFKNMTGVSPTNYRKAQENKKRSQ